MSAARRIAIVGSAASGKSTLARELENLLGIPAYHLDALYWQPGWKPTQASDWDALMREILAQDAWIVDGGFTKSMEERFAAADTLIFLDPPRWACIAAAIRRRILYPFRRPPGMAVGCRPHFDVQLLRWIWRFPLENRPSILAALSAHVGHKRVVVVRRRAEVRRVVRSLAATAGGSVSVGDTGAPFTSAVGRLRP